MKTLLFVIVCAVVTVSANAAVIPNCSQTNQVTLMPKKFFTSHKPTLLINKITIKQVLDDPNI